VAGANGSPSGAADQRSVSGLAMDTSSFSGSHRRGPLCGPHIANT
jgi:hypothetical protein